MRPTVPATLLRVLGAACLVATLGAGSAAATSWALPSAASESALVSAPAATVGSIRITRMALNARGHPTIASKALFVVSPRTTVRVYRIATDSEHRPWYLVHVESRPGWIAGWLTDAVPVRIAGAWTTVMASSFGVGDGLVGARMACGAELTTTVMAVAHRTLPCGAQVRIRIGSRTVVARVLDRGPFMAGRTFDLAPAVCRALASCDGVFRIQWQRVP